MEGFQVAGGTIPGTRHTKPGQPGWGNNQDAFQIVSGKNFLAAVVCDGCGDKENPYSEVGARIGAELATLWIKKLLATNITFSITDQSVFLRELKNGVLNRLIGMVREMLIVPPFGEPFSKSFDEMIRKYFLFTLVGAVVTPEHSIIFSLGDGVYALNGETFPLEKYEKNAPPYIAYNLVHPHFGKSGDLDFKVCAIRRTEEVESILIGTDGVLDFTQEADSLLPGREEKLGSLSQFWESDLYVKNPDAIRRRLAQANREVVLDNRIKGGLLPDDTTIALIRRLKE